VLILETSHRAGRVALAEDERILGERVLEESRRHARDLVPFLQELLQAQGWRPRDLHAVVAGRGPGSYTGLRVGLMSAKTLAYTTGCTLLAIDTFAVIARQCPATERSVHVIADAQQDKLYAQHFTDGEAAPLTIQPIDSWLLTLKEGASVIGPGLEKCEGRLSPRVRLAPKEAWYPRVESLLHLGLERLNRGEKDDPFAVEPLYLRPSSAEQNWRK
jgi:tRNA threonylcarbamoyladenosine biosynthesis protein TsaB